MFWSLFLRALQGFTDFVQFLFQTKMIPSLSSIYQLLGFTEITSWCRKFSVTRSSEMFVQVRLLTYGQGTVASAKTLYFRTTLAHIKTAKQSFFCIGHSYDCVHSLNEKRVRLRRDASYLFIYLFLRLVRKNPRFWQFVSFSVDFKSKHPTVWQPNSDSTVL